MSYLLSYDDLQWNKISSDKSGCIKPYNYRICLKPQLKMISLKHVSHRIVFPFSCKGPNLYFFFFFNEGEAVVVNALNKVPPSI